MKIPFFDYPSVYLRYQSEFAKTFNDVCARGAFIMQRELEVFEEKLADVSGCRYAIGVGNATDALEMLVEFARLRFSPDCETPAVLVSDHTMGATAASIYRNGFTPKVVDFDENHGMSLSALTESDFENVVGIMPTQLNGRVSDMAPILETCSSKGLFLIEDSAQGLGATLDGRAAGSFGLGGCISFYPAKVVGALGDAGAVVTNDPEVNMWIRLARDHGRNPDTGKIEFWGRNSRLDNLQAGFLCAVLDDYEFIKERRIEIAQIYCDELSDLRNIKLPQSPESERPYKSIWQNFEIRAEQRDALKSFLSGHGIGTLVQWGGVRISEVASTEKTALPFSDAEFSKLLMLPMNLTITNDEVRYVADCIKKFYEEAE